MCVRVELSAVQPLKATPLKKTYSPSPIYNLLRYIRVEWWRAKRLELKGGNNHTRSALGSFRRGWNYKVLFVFCRDYVHLHMLKSVDFYNKKIETNTCICFVFKIWIRSWREGSVPEWTALSGDLSSDPGTHLSVLAPDKRLWELTTPLY